MMKEVLGEIGCFMRFLGHTYGFDGRRSRRTPIKMADWEWIVFSLSWGVGGAFLAHWLFG
jgi:hypothetical protein